MNECTSASLQQFALETFLISSIGKCNFLFNLKYRIQKDKCDKPTPPLKRISSPILGKVGVEIQIVQLELFLELPRLGLLLHPRYSSRESLSESIDSDRASALEQTRAEKPCRTPNDSDRASVLEL
jgi:hypothetical protein